MIIGGPRRLQDVERHPVGLGRRSKIGPTSLRDTAMAVPSWWVAGSRFAD
jgi:hypothetical protein